MDDDKKIGINWESECKSLAVKLDSTRCENEQLKCQMVNDKDICEAKLKDAERTIKILQEHQREDKATINELLVYKRFYDDVVARR